MRTIIIQIRPVVLVAVGWPLVPTGYGYLHIQFCKDIIAIFASGPRTIRDMDYYLKT